MTVPLFADKQDLLRQRRLERGLPAEQQAPPSARSLLLLGGSISLGLLALVLGSWSLISLRDRLVVNQIASMNAIPAQLQALEAELRSSKATFDQLSASNAAIAQGLVAVSSGSALITQLAQLAPDGLQITEATVAGPSLSLKGRVDDPGAFTRVNALSLLLAYAPLFKADQVKVVKLTREAPSKVLWDLGAGFASLKFSEQLPLLRKLGADGMSKRLQELVRLGVLQ